jgi:hypothetical protein
MRRKQGQNILEERWKLNRKLRERPHHSFVTINKITGLAQHGPANRPERLRGDDFVRELARLGSVWWDERFLNCIEALFEHGIVESVDGLFHFTGKKEPIKQQIAARKQQTDSYYVAQVRALVERKDMSVRSACDEVAATTGYPSRNFSAASDRLRKLYQKRFPKNSSKQARN